MNNETLTLTFKEVAEKLLAGNRVEIGKHSVLILLNADHANNFYEFEADGANISGPKECFLTCRVQVQTLSSTREVLYNHRKDALIRRALKLQSEGYWRVMSCPMLKDGIWLVHLRAIELCPEPEPIHEVL